VQRGAPPAMGCALRRRKWQADKAALVARCGATKQHGFPIYLGAHCFG